MTKIPKPRFEKAGDNSIRIIVEKIDDVPLTKLLKNREQLVNAKITMRKEVEQQEVLINERIKNIDEILVEAKRLGIVVKPESKTEEIKKE